MAIGRKKRMGDMLIEEGAITPEQLTIALKEQKEKKQKLGEVLLDLGYVDEHTIADVLHKQLNLKMISLAGINIEERVTKLVSEPILRKHMMMPFAFDEKNPNILLVAMADPLDFLAHDDLSIITNCRIEPFIATSSEIARTIDKYYGKDEVMAVVRKYASEREKKIKAQEEELAAVDDVSSSPIVLLVKSIIEQAVRQRASDIHIEPLNKEIRVRYRVDGALYETLRYDLSLLQAIVARIKIISGMDISEKRKPQDGRISIIVDRNEYDIRASILPTTFGEKTVLRIAAKKNLSRNKKELGFSGDELIKFDKILKNPHGLILVTGPTGSGKSTTLYTALSELNKEDINIITVEDPVEANINGINQVQVNNKADLTFANALRSILRQDPDVIMIGEIRDDETAEIAIKASITGHLVVSTLHTNNAPSSITRLMDMGVESYLIADATVGVIAQRLVRRLCPKCKQSKETDFIEAKMLGLAKGQVEEIFTPIGCSYCNGKGYYGRIAVYEIMSITPKIREIIAKKGTADSIEAVALDEGMTTLKASAIRLVLDGITDINELKTITYN